MFKANTSASRSISGKYPTKYPGQHHNVLPTPFNANVIDTFTPERGISPETVIAPYAGFVNGELVIGDYEPIDTSDATAGAADIALGKTAYVNNVKITGTLDLTEADIVAGDVALGKIAYGANGVKIIGTAV